MVTGSNIKATLSHIDLNLKLNISASCHLSIQVNLDGFSFAILNIQEQKYIALEHYDIQNCTTYNELAEQLDKIIKQQEMLHQNFATISISIDHSLNTLTPKALYDDANGKDILGFNQALLQNEEENSDWLSSIQAFNSYVIPEELKRCFNKYFPNHKWKHDSSILIESLLQQFKLQEGEKIYLSIQNTYFELIVLDGKKLKFFNNFSYKSAADLIYYLLFTCEQLNLNPDQVSLIISGEIEEESEVYKILYKYVRNISFINRNPNYEYSFVFDEVKEHHYYKLLNQHLCVS